MASTYTAIHLDRGDTPKVIATKQSDFFTIRVEIGSNEVTFFLGDEKDAKAMAEAMAEAVVNPC